MASNKVQAQISVNINSGASEVKRLQTQLDELAKKLSLNIKQINLSGQSLSSSSSNISKTVKQSSQELNRYQTELNKVIHAYKMKQTADDKFLNTAQKMMKSYKFQELAWKEQERLINLVARAEKNYQSVRDRTTQINRTMLQNEQNIAQERLRIEEQVNQRWQRNLRMREIQEEASIRARQQRMNSLNSSSSNVRIYDSIQQQSTQSSMTGRMQTLQNRFSSMQSNSGFGNVVDANQLSLINSQLQALQANIGRVSNNRMAQQWNTQFAQVNNQLRSINQQLPRTIGFFENLANISKKFAEWILVGNAVMMVMHQFQNSVKFIVDMDTALTNLSKVTNLTKNELNAMGDAAIQMGKDLGHSSIDIAKSMAEFGRVTKDMGEIKELSRVNMYCPAV